MSPGPAALSPRPLVCANWKMHLTPEEAERFAVDLRKRLAGSSAGATVEIAIAPSYPALERLGHALEGSAVMLAAQNVHEASEGAFTGEVSVGMLESLDCRYALIGHSERRQLFGEQDATIAAKASRLVESTVRPILCIGETLDEREADRTLEVVGRQLTAVLDTIAPAGTEIAPDGPVASMVVAYEPVWAIGTGRTATPEMAQAVHAEIRKTLCARLGDDMGAGIRILYGGSVKPSNARELLAQTDINGALVGGASLEPDSFSEIIMAAQD